MGKGRKKNAGKAAATRAKIASKKLAQEVLDLTYRKSTETYVNSNFDHGVMNEIELVKVVTTYPEMVALIPEDSITPVVAEAAVCKDSCCFRWVGPMRSHTSVVLAAVIKNPSNWDYVHPSLFGREEFVWWAIDVGLIDQSMSMLVNKEIRITLVPILSSEIGVMCLLAKYSYCWLSTFGWRIQIDDRLAEAKVKIEHCKQPFSLMKEILRKRILIALLFESQEVLEVGLAEKIAGYLTIPLSFYSLLNRKKKDPRYRKLWKK